MQRMHTQLNNKWMTCTPAGIFSVDYGHIQFLFSRDGFSIKS